MEINWVEDFVCLADVRSFSRAAEKRNVSQPAFSRRIQALETWLGVVLVDRSSNPLTLTHSGRAFRSFAEGFLRQLYQARGALQKNRDLSGQKIRFAVTYSLSLGFFPGWLSSVGGSFGETVIEVDEVGTAEGQAALVAGEIDFFVCHHHPRLPALSEPDRYASITLGREVFQPYSACDEKGGPQFRLPGAPGRPLPYLAYAGQTYFAHAVNMILMNASQPHYLEPCYEGKMADVLRVMAGGGHGLAWLPENCVSASVDGRKLVPAGGPKWSTELEIRIFRSARTRHAAIDGLWDLLSARMESE